MEVIQVWLKKQKMNTSSKIHLIITSLINLALIFWMVSIVWLGNDKAVLVIIFSYPILTIVNALIWIVLRLLKHSHFKVYKVTTLSLLALLIPTGVIAISR
jgi:hypothetical protein